MPKNENITKGPHWTKNWVEKMWRFTSENFVDFDTGAIDFEALGREEYDFRKALFYRNFKNSERARETFEEAEKIYTQRTSDGKKGGRPPAKCQLPKNKQEVIEFAIDNNLDPDDASTWAEQNLRERRGRDKDGNPINNWKGALTNYCKAMKTRRSA